MVVFVKWCTCWTNALKSAFRYILSTSKFNLMVSNLFAWHSPLQWAPFLRPRHIHKCVCLTGYLLYIMYIVMNFIHTIELLLLRSVVLNLGSIEPRLRSAWPLLAAADHVTLLGFDICAAGNLVVDLWLLWLYVICDFRLIFQSLHTNYVEQKKKVVGWMRTIWIHLYKGTKEICFEEIVFYFSNYEGFGECTDEASRVQYLQ